MWSYNSSGFRALDNPDTILPGEVFFDHDPSEAELDAAFPGRNLMRLEIARATRWDMVKAERYRREAGDGFEHKGRVFDSDPDSIARLLVAKDAIIDAAAAGNPIMLDWTLKNNNVWKGMTVDDFAGLTVSIAIAKNAVHQHARQLRERIEAATTIEEVDAIPIWQEASASILFEGRWESGPG